MQIKHTKEKILETAVELFASEGYTSVSIRQLTKAVGIKESSFYNHFGSKKELLDSIFEKFKEESELRASYDREIERVVAGKSPVNALKYFLFGFIKYWSNPANNRIWYVISTEQYRNKTAADLLLNETERMIENNVKIFRKLIEIGRIKEHAPELLAREYSYPLRAMHSEYSLRQIHGYSTKEIEDRMKRHIEFFYR